MQPIVRPVVRCDGPEQDVKRLIGKEPILEFMSSKAGTIVVGLFICFSFSGYSYQLLGGGLVFFLNSH